MPNLFKGEPPLPATPTNRTIHCCSLQPLAPAQPKQWISGGARCPRAKANTIKQPGLQILIARHWVLWAGAVGERGDESGSAAGVEKRGGERKGE